MSNAAWVHIMKDGIERGFRPGNKPTPFFVDEHTKTGMMWYFGEPWLFPVEKIDE